MIEYLGEVIHRKAFGQDWLKAIIDYWWNKYHPIEDEM